MVRQCILEHADVQIIELAETKFREDDNFTLPGFTWFGHNRADIHKKARVGSGGVGFLVRNDILCEYDISILDITKEGMMWLEFIHKTVDISFKTCVCYLPPSNYTRGVDCEEFFNNPVTQIAEYQSDTQPFIRCGDFNARCADIPDHIEGVDDLPPRDVIDWSVNNYGDPFCEFLTSVNCCIVNGRNSTQNDFTCRNVSVVDYCIIPYE